jgi:hypothetical protein
MVALAFAIEYCWVIDADGDAVGDVTVTVKPAAALKRVVRRDATTVASVSLETPTVDRSITPYLI